MRRLAAVGLISILSVANLPPAFGQSERAARIKSHVREILSSHEFRDARPHTTWLERMGKRTGEAIKSFFEWLERLFRFGRGPRGITSSSNLLFWILWPALIVGIAIVIAYALRRFGGRLGFDQRRSHKVADLLDIEDPAEISPDRWLDAARAYASQGDFRRAYRAVFLAVLLRLDHSGVIKFDRSRTNGEYLRESRRRGHIFALLQPFALDFDRRWYGQAPATESDFMASLETYRQTETLLGPESS